MSKWMAHLKQTMRKNKGMKLGQAMKLAAKTYKKHKGGAGEAAAAEGAPAAAEGVAEAAAPVGGRRRRGTRKGGKTARRTRRR